MISPAELKGARVLVVGDLMLDEYVWGEVHRISPEAPVPVVEVSRRTLQAGGAANAAAGVVALEGEARVVGVVGDDTGGAALREAMRETRVNQECVILDSARPTTTKVRVIAHSQQVVRTDSETRDALAPELEERVCAEVADRIAASQALLISDYGKGVVSERVARSAIDAARKHEVPVVVDSKGLHYSRFRGATVITPNVQDAERASRIHIEGEEHLREAARRLSEDCGGAALLITRGAAGMTLFSVDHPLHVPAQAREVYDVTGAGDTVVAVLAVALAKGAELPDAVRLANAAAGVVVGKVGTSTVTLEELSQAVESA